MHRISRLAIVGGLVAFMAACASPPHMPSRPLDRPVPSDEPATPEALTLHLKCLLTDGVSERIEACTSAINSGLLPLKMQANTLAVRGAMYLRQRRHSDARIDFEDAKRLDPENPQIDEGLALVARSEARASPEQLTQMQAAFDCQGLDDPKARLAACDLYVSRTIGQPNSQAMAYDARAFVKLWQRDTAGAIEDLDRAIALSPDDPEFKDHRLRAQFMHGDYRAALPGLTELLKAEPYNEALKTIVATIYYVDGRKQDALSEFEAMTLWERQASLPAARALSIRLEPPAEDDPLEALRGRSMAQWMGALVRYRMSELPESEFRSDMATFLPREDGFDTCLIEFQVAHNAALGGDMTAARIGFDRAIKECGVGEFEYHAAKAWLKHLSS